MEIPKDLDDVEIKFLSEEIGHIIDQEQPDGKIHRRILINKYADLVNNAPHLIKNYNIIEISGDGSELLLAITNVCKPILSKAERKSRVDYSMHQLSIAARQIISRIGIDEYNRQFT